ncbi:hypothetical protein [Streptomyces mirabilis]|uniref:hypothetical protein n=1 Tax=Streptomyces mirabilis TaxID=68239 RepID=UPI0036E0344A
MTTTPFMSREGLTRLRMVGATLAVGVAVPIGVARQAWAAPTASGPVQVTLPVPTVLRPAAERAHPEVQVSRPGPPEDLTDEDVKASTRKFVVGKAENEPSAVTRPAPSQGFRT